MPINREQIPDLIKSSEEKKLPAWKKNYFEKIAKALQVHTKGQLFKKVDTLFPHEHPDSKAHCVSTYEPITKASIWKGINNILRIFSSSSFTFNVGEELNKWLEVYEFDGNNILNYFLQEWVHKAIAEDPNGIFVVYPPDWAEERGMSPIQWVRSEFIRSRSSDYISFVSERDSEVAYNYAGDAIKREVFYDPSVDLMNAKTCTETTYNERLTVTVQKEVVHLFTREGFLIYEPAEKRNEYAVTIVDFADDLQQLPFFTGGGPVADKADHALYESFVQSFVPFGNLSLLQHRNHRAVDLQFSYPRMSELQTPCDHQGCAGGRVKCRKSTKYPDGLMDCPKCHGKAFLTVQSPYKVYTQRYDPNDQNENKHLQVDPVKFYSPDVGIIDYSKTAWKDYLKQAEESIFVMQKVQTGNVQSAESKEIDLDDLYAWLLGISKTFYNNLRQALQCLEDYMARNPVTVSVDRPYSFAILTEAEAFIALNNILMSSAPVFLKGERVDNFVNKFVSRDSPVIRALAVLKQYDPLLFYSHNEVATFKSSNVISQDMYIKHVLGYPVMLQLYMADRAFFNNSDEQIMTAIDAQIKTFNIAAAGEEFRKTILKAVEEAA